MCRKNMLYMEYIPSASVKLSDVEYKFQAVSHTRLGRVFTHLVPLDYTNTDDDPQPPVAAAV